MPLSHAEKEPGEMCDLGAPITLALRNAYIVSRRGAQASPQPRQHIIGFNGLLVAISDLAIFIALLK